MENWFNLSIDETKKKLDTDYDFGITQEEVELRRQKYGLNELEAKRKKSIIIKFLDNHINSSNS